jgi:hypothetical protein
VLHLGKIANKIAAGVNSVKGVVREKTFQRYVGIVYAKETPAVRQHLKVVIALIATSPNI